ncbi:uncharacterized protein LOC112566336 [Pomacea canaliculata]|uniref:uncharacterized protein LOC112566336 n=1 Tax=Pomacea canaliculata TaxID=400727 RepID=UPI000D72B1C5|nr:uncharacterized protein LOC112566336 [Pomacea canaliculata]
MSLTIKASEEQAVGKPHLHNFQFFEDEGQVELAVETMVAAAEKQRVNILVDEYENGEHDLSKRWHRFVSEVCNHIGNVRLWIASSKGTNLPPELHKETLTVPLRSAPSVVAEVDKGVRALANIPDYTSAGIPAPLDGPQVIRLHHQGPDHLEANIVECEQCGRNIATELKQLKVGAGQANASPVQKRPAPLRYCDVFILVHSYDLLGTSSEDSSGKVNGLVRGLRDAGIPVRVVRDRSRGVEGWDCDVRDTSVARTDMVTVSDWGDVVGMERKVVVWLPGRIPGDDDKLSDEHLDRIGRLWAMSRCIVQLILVDIPTNSE